MQLPSESVSYRQRIRFGLYVAARLKRAKLAALAKSAADATTTVKVAGRAVEDAEEPIEDAIALRDGADDDLDDAAQQARLKLGARSLTAAKSKPYTDIFPQGIGYYVAANLDEEIRRYEEFQHRVEESLPPGDEVRKETVPALKTGLKDFADSSKSIEKGRTELAVAATRLDSAERAWERLMDKIYGTLIGEVGRGKAEQFFPRRRRSAPEERAPEPAKAP